MLAVSVNRLVKTTTFYGTDQISGNLPFGLLLVT